MMVNVEIRTAGVADIDAIQRLNRELDRCHTRLLPEIFRPVEGDARPDSLVREWVEDPDADFLVAEDEGGIVGFVSVRKSASPPYPMFRPREFAVIDDLVVGESRRGTGIGTALIDAAAGWAARRGLGRIQATVWSANRSAREFYARRGFRPVRETLELDSSPETRDP